LIFGAGEEEFLVFSFEFLVRGRRRNEIFWGPTPNDGMLNLRGHRPIWYGMGNWFDLLSIWGYFVG